MSVFSISEGKLHGRDHFPQIPKVPRRQCSMRRERIQFKRLELSMAICSFSQTIAVEDPFFRHGKKISLALIHKVSLLYSAFT